jgi:transcriptional regulator with XRE-family HTH domain
MSKRSNQKRINRPARVLRFLREQSQLSQREAATLCGLSSAVIAHLEQGRIDIHQRHLDRLLPIYKSTPESFALFAAGRVELPQNLKFECIEIIKQMTHEQIRTAHPVLSSLINRK